jgi:SOUL heme-binding protein
MKEGQMLRDIIYYAQVLLEAGVGVVGIRPYEEPRYAVVAALPDGVEIRRYAPRLAAQVEVPGDGAEARDEAFRILFRYIAGGNVGAEKIEMTVPVATGPRTEKIAMTVPVATAPGDGGGLRMQFFLPARYTAETAPRPGDERVRIVPVAEETVAILRFSGRGTAEELARRKAELLEAIAPTPWQPSGEAAILFYDAPSTPPFLRRNEAAVRVDHR